MEGMLIGLIKMFNEPEMQVELIEEKTSTGKDFDLFRIARNN